MLDPLVSLATSVHTQPGVYALLLGSGVSTGAGIPTGWGIIEALVRDLATAAEPDVPDAANAASADPEAWWAKHGDGQPLGYSNLLAAMAPTSAGRRAVLARFFEPSDEDREDGLKAPSAAHRAIAELVRRGAIRVILTTNFDRLLERALEEVGISPQIVATPDAVAGMTPLVHAPCTIIKLHGDVVALEQRNTIDELSEYPAAFDSLVDQVLDDYGLVVCGWSADWDVALVAAFERARRRRYPLYWAARSGPRGEAAKLVAQHGAVIIQGVSADELFSDVLGRLDALDRLTDPPLTRDLAVARLKRLLPDPTKHIEVHDLLLKEVDKIADAVAAHPSSPPDTTGQGWQDLHDALARSTSTLLHLLATGVFFDRDGLHTDTWLTVIGRLMRTRTQPIGSYDQRCDALQHYPALLALRTAGLAALLAKREEVLLRLFRQPTWRNRLRNDEEMPAVVVLHDHDVLNENIINAFPRWAGTRWIYATAHLLMLELREPLRALEPDDDSYKVLVHGYELRAALAQKLAGERFAAPGLFISDWQWDRDTGQLRAEIAFRQSGDLPAWGLTDSLKLDDVMNELREELKKSRRHG
jgi:hypothetical protein